MRKWTRWGCCKMNNSLNWILMFEAFEKFRRAAETAGLQDDRIEGIEEHIMSVNPIPQPKPMKV